jgi:hypothetical protein
MIQATPKYRPVVGAILRALMVFDAVALLFAGIVHLVGARIPLGIGVFVEPPILPAGIVESLAGLLFAWATYAARAHARSAWPAALTAHLFAIAGFVVGIVATLSGTTPFNNVYHRVMLAVFVVGLILLLTSPGREALSHHHR